jgi:hypothetical protein
LLWRDDVVEDRQRTLNDAIQARTEGIAHLTPPPRRVLSSEATEESR